MSSRGLFFAWLGSDFTQNRSGPPSVGLQHFWSKVMERCLQAFGLTWVLNRFPFYYLFRPTYGTFQFSFFQRILFAFDEESL